MIAILNSYARGSDGECINANNINDTAIGISLTISNIADELYFSIQSDIKKVLYR